MVFPKLSGPVLTKMIEISINKEQNIGEVEPINLVTTCATK